ncbi:DMT family transporter [Pseudomonas sp. GX19020]|uniref:DMT family transporter n=1 Tax=Pseudomonas sp. GX19020 TaxID=2942277 RepID=UPI002018A1C6|nr:DMT family transporter [Pseudomonas sp. GX19020]MCL4067076.1 DMT family transporter [Pseudomonas sp. GX19020]
MQIPTSPNRFALPGLLLGGVLIGCSPIWVRLSEVGSVSTAFWRLALALIPLALMAGGGRSGGAAQPKTLRDRVEISLPGVILGVELVAWHISLHLTSVANSTLLVNMAPVFVALFAWIVLKKPPGRLFMLALAVTIIGVVVLKGGPAALRDGDLRGDGIAIFAAMLYAAYILMLGRARQRFATGVIMLWSTAAAAIAVFPFALMTDPSLIPLTLAGWGVLIGLSWISQAGGQSLIAWALAFLPATFSSLTLLLQPVIAALLAWAVLDEALTLTQALGGVIVLCGIWIARAAQMRQA